MTSAIGAAISRTSVHPVSSGTKPVGSVVYVLGVRNGRRGRAMRGPPSSAVTLPLPSSALHQTIILSLSRRRRRLRMLEGARSLPLSSALRFSSFSVATAPSGFVTTYRIGPCRVSTASKHAAGEALNEYASSYLPMYQRCLGPVPTEQGNIPWPYAHQPPEKAGDSMRRRRYGPRETWPRQEDSRDHETRPSRQIRESTASKPARP